MLVAISVTRNAAELTRYLQRSPGPEEMNCGIRSNNA